MNQKCHTLYFANILALWQVLLWCQIGAARRNQKVKNFKNFENRAHFSFNISKTKSAKNFKLSHHVLCYLWLKKRDFFQSVLVFNWILPMQKIVSIPFFSFENIVFCFYRSSNLKFLPMFLQRHGKPSKWVPQAIAFCWKVFLMKLERFLLSKTSVF